MLERLPPLNTLCCHEDEGYRRILCKGLHPGYSTHVFRNKRLSLKLTLQKCIVLNIFDAATKGFLTGGRRYYKEVSDGEMFLVKGRVISINISDKKGIRKKPVNEAEIVTDFGIKGDAHASRKWHRQISLLALESIAKMQDRGCNVKPGDFAENITTEGINLVGLPIGTPMNIGNVSVEVSQIGKECHTKCSIYNQAGDCIMPKEGIFVKVIKGGTIKQGDSIEVQKSIKGLK
jgi:hypothetical protein